MDFNVHDLCADYNFIVSGASYIGHPRDNTVMFITTKVGNLIKNLEGINHCLIYAENGVNVSQDLKKENCFVFSDHPQREYALFLEKFAEDKERQDIERKYRLTEDGYYIGEGVVIGADSYIEPLCVIGHDVVIGKNSYICAGTIIKNSVIGDYFLANENSVIGANGFTMTEDKDGNKLRIPTLGKVIIGDHVEVGSHDNISCGSAGDTIIDNCVKLDTQVHIGHDAHIGTNTEITAGVVVGGFVEIGNDSYIGINATLRNRIVVEEKGRISMGAVVTQRVNAGQTVTGNFAVDHERFLFELKEANQKAEKMGNNKEEDKI